MCGVVDGGIVAGPVGLRGRPERRRRHLRLVRRHRRARRVRAAAGGAGRRRARIPHRAGAADSRSASTACVALDWHSGNRSVLVDHELSGLIVGPDPGHPARGHLPRAAGGDRLRHPHHRRDLRRRRGAGDRVHRGRRPAQERAADADLRRRHRPAAVARRLRAGPALGSAIHAAVAAGAYPDVPAAAAAMGSRIEQSSTCPIRRTSAVYDGLYAEYRELHDYFGRGGNDVMHRLAAATPARRPAWQVTGVDRSPDRRRQTHRPGCASRSASCMPS